MHKILAGLFCLAASAVLAGETKPPEVDVILWFDTEDYLLPADDDAAKRLCEMLTQRNIRATFKVVGEKARVLKKRGRTDVIDALKKHDIGYHSDFHSVHPTPSEFLAECGWLDGVAEFVRRQAKGAQDVRDIFGVPTLSCYGQPGSSWGSQAIGALKSIGVAPHGIPCYVDEGSHVGLDEKPFWFVGALNVYRMGKNHTRVELHNPGGLEPGKEAASKVVERLAKEGGGLISIYYHPCEWVHKEFWDGVNFKRGANPPRELWKAPGQLTEQETDAAFERFGLYIDYLKSLPGVKFVTASDLPELYPDRVRTEGVTARELDQIAAELLVENTTGVSYLTIGGKSFSAADQFELLAQALTDVNRIGAVSFPIKPSGLIGPDSAPPQHSELKRLDWSEFIDALRDAREFARLTGRVPSRVFAGASAIPPADFLVPMAAAYAHQQKNRSLPTQEGVPLRALELLAVTRVATELEGEDNAKQFGGWIIHKEGFRAPKILDVARLQTWSLKPAVRAK